ncbi:hypothetical protein BDW74DRAFT_155225 [Aspergillus multicolor]|uniref:uncharacterized protein n=1 Tax=Aspergillus multicolor TaxID=41759 RepID=UPI003CCDD703
MNRMWGLVILLAHPCILQLLILRNLRTLLLFASHDLLLTCGAAQLRGDTKSKTPPSGMSVVQLTLTALRLVAGDLTTFSRYI